MRVFKDATEAHANDRILLTLPLYHATGGMCGVGTALNAGACVVLRRKFSASHFWQEAIDNKATMLVYIGELGRYLMNQPASALEKKHSIKKGFGKRAARRCVGAVRGADRDQPAGGVLRLDRGQCELLQSRRKDWRCWTYSKATARAAAGTHPEVRHRNGRAGARA